MGFEEKCPRKVTNFAIVQDSRKCVKCQKCIAVATYMARGVKFRLAAFYSAFALFRSTAGSNRLERHRTRENPAGLENMPRARACPRRRDQGEDEPIAHLRPFQSRRNAALQATRRAWPSHGLRNVHKIARDYVNQAAIGTIEVPNQKQRRRHKDGQNEKPFDFVTVVS